MLKQMRLTRREKKGDVQHLLARSFSRRQFSTSSPSPPRDIQIAVPPRLHEEPSIPEEREREEEEAQRDEVGAVLIEELTMEPRVAGSRPQQVVDEAAVEMEGPGQSGGEKCGV